MPKDPLLWVCLCTLPTLTDQPPPSSEILATPLSVINNRTRQRAPFLQWCCERWRPIADVLIKRACCLVTVQEPLYLCVREGCSPAQTNIHTPPQGHNPLTAWTPLPHNQRPFTYWKAASAIPLIIWLNWSFCQWRGHGKAQISHSHPFPHTWHQQQSIAPENHAKHETTKPASILECTDCWRHAHNFFFFFN